MGKKEKKFGNCVICGEYGVLTQEHVPPKRAFNNNRYYVHLINDEDPLAEPVKKWYKQGGIRFYTLCEKCNNNTGAWYANEYIDWCYFGMDILRRSNGRPSLYYFNKIYPLRVIKQIIVMMFSVNNDSIFRELNPYLEQFVLNKWMNHLPPEYNVYVYYNIRGKPRYKGYTVSYDKGKISVLCEVTYPPYGFVLTLQDSPPPDDRLTKISHFADFQYDTEWEIELNLNSLPTWLPNIPADYRTKEEIQTAILNSKQRKR
ncbi:hypothetical protein [Xanthovirga aplysinae]|uniref:hypothetical protein n=1 Tax=Xanthovirga aplysinae TaxID=2529853 RepID=UPI0012BD69EE|nr:hypothetical protein [Xanthovirga aplysinae]MTI29315.1 hypothetical protein [Xanthovirga aplysinae]